MTPRRDGYPVPGHQLTGAAVPDWSPAFPYAGLA